MSTASSARRIRAAVEAIHGIYPGVPVRYSVRSTCIVLVVPVSSLVLLTKRWLGRRCGIVPGAMGGRACAPRAFTQEAKPWTPRSLAEGGRLERTEHIREETVNDEAKRENEHDRAR